MNNTLYLHGHLSTDEIADEILFRLKEPMHYFELAKYVAEWILINAIVNFTQITAKFLSLKTVN